MSPAQVFAHFHRDTLEWENEDLITTDITNPNTEFDQINKDDLYTIYPQRRYKRKGLVRDLNDVEFDDKIKAEQIVESVGMEWNL